MPFRVSSTTPPKAQRTGSSRPARLRSVLVVSLVASAVTLALAGAGAIGFWYLERPYTQTAAHGQALETLAGRAFTTAWDAGALFRDSAARDLSRVISLWRNAGGDPMAADAENMAVRDITQPAGTAGRVMGHSSRERPTEGLAHVKGPVVTGTIDPPTATAVPVEPSLHTVFDRRDIDVTPPRMWRVRLRRASLPGPFSRHTSDQAGLVEVVVSVSGAVESAKFVTRPLNVHEAMLLSAVKAWRFRPAMKNGQAIRYRLTMPIRRARI